MFLMVGGESAFGINSPGGVWTMATSINCDKDVSRSVTEIDGGKWVELDST